MQSYCANEVYQTRSTVQSFFILAADVWEENLRGVLKSLQANREDEHSVVDEGNLRLDEHGKKGKNRVTSTRDFLEEIKCNKYGYEGKIGNNKREINSLKLSQPQRRGSSWTSCRSVC